MTAFRVLLSKANLVIWWICPFHRLGNCIKCYISDALDECGGRPPESYLEEKASILLREVAEYFFYVMRGRKNTCLSGDAGEAALSAGGCALFLLWIENSEAVAKGSPKVAHVPHLRKGLQDGPTPAWAQRLWVYLRQPSAGTPAGPPSPDSLAWKQISAVEGGSPFSVFYFSVQVAVCIPSSAFALGPNILSPDGLGYFLHIWAFHVTGSPHCSAPAVSCSGGEWHRWDVGTQAVPGSQGLIHPASLAKAHRGYCPFDQ